ncbi:phosphopantetheine-binding protein [Burkholderia gladioli]|uniref:phosphopantetheine-binding protein n=1 Tax=Burkholderia gladioli TaxID=28095 RepID=UPI00398C50A7
MGRQDNFFALGGHSLLAVRVIGRLRERFGEAATLKTLFEAPSLAAFARRLALAGAAQAGASAHGGAARFTPAASAARREAGRVPAVLRAGAAVADPAARRRPRLQHERRAGARRALVDGGAAGRLRRLVARHETLRTRVRDRRGQRHALAVRRCPAGGGLAGP